MKDKLKQAADFLELALKTDNHKLWYEAGAAKQALTLINEISESLDGVKIIDNNRLEIAINEAIDDSVPLMITLKRGDLKSLVNRLVRLVNTKAQDAIQTVKG